MLPTRLANVREGWVRASKRALLQPTAACSSSRCVYVSSSFRPLSNTNIFKITSLKSTKTQVYDTWKALEQDTWLWLFPRRNVGKSRSHRGVQSSFARACNTASESKCSQNSRGNRPIFLPFENGAGNIDPKRLDSTVSRLFRRRLDTQMQDQACRSRICEPCAMPSLQTS